MRTTFSGISIALRALQAQQVSLDITGHNVANVNNPNFSRQTALHSATKPYPAPMMGYTPSSGQLGTGVEISQINRMRDSFVDLRLRQQLHNLNYWNTMQDGLKQVELFFNEPGENGIHHALDQFWDSLQDLSREPDFFSVREVVIQRAQVLVESITATRGQLQNLRDNLNENITFKISEVNSLAKRLADLNVQISATGSLPNDLLDARDALLEELSQLVDIEVVQDHANMVSVAIGGSSLVHRGTSHSLMTNGVASEAENYKKNQVFWSATGNVVKLSSGEIAGMMRLRDQEIQQAINDLDTWTRDFALEFNRRHEEGYDFDGDGGLGLPLSFFTFDNQVPGDPPDPNFPFAAQNIRVNTEIADNVGKIRASLIPGAVGNGENALKLARLRFEPVIEVDEETQVTVADAFNSLISRLGVSTQKAVKMAENEATLEAHLRNLKESHSGVSLDEEMANMIRYQHAYSAAARMMTAVDETLDTIINRLGIVGR